MRRFVPRALLSALVVVSAAGCAAGGYGVDPTSDIGGRYLVLVPDLEGPSGPQVANELRRLISEMPTHAAINDKAVQAALAQYEVEDFTEITARQLAPLIQAQLVSWGTVTPGGAGLEADIKFIDARSGDEILVDAAGATPTELAAEIFLDFSQSMEGVNQARYCNDYLSSDQFDRAIETCEAALAIVPTSTAALYGLATAHYNLERFEEALAGYNRVLAIDATHQDALLGAGLSASALDRSDEAMAFYNRYLEVNPGNVDVRMTVANDIAQTGDVISAFGVLESAIADNQENVDFQEYLFNIAASAGTRALEQGDSTTGRRILTAAYDAYQAAFGSAEEVPVAALRRAVGVTSALGRNDDAIRLAQEGTQRFSDDAEMWSAYARALRDAGRYGESAQAWTRVIEIDPTVENVYLRRAMAYSQAGQRQQALADLDRAAQGGDRANVAQVLLGMGSQAINANNFAEAEAVLAPALQYAPAGAQRNQISFFLGYSIYKQAEAIANANSQGNVEPARRALALFQRVIPLVQGSGHSSEGAVVSGTRQFIANQEAIIQAGSR